MSSYGDGNSYRGVACRESQTPTIVYRSDEVVTLLEQRIRELVQQCERLRERLDAELYGFAFKARGESDD